MNLRITVEEVQKAYEVCKLGKKRRAFYFFHNHCVCPLTALYLEENPNGLEGVVAESVIADRVKAWADKKYGSYYREGFIVGVDTGSPIRHVSHYVNSRDQRYLEGGKDGLAVFNALFTKVGNGSSV